MREPVPHSVKELATRKVDDIYSFFENSYVTPRREGRDARLAPQRALDVNTLGEVPDSAWYTNRHAFRHMSIAELERGPGNSSPPSPDSWKVVGAKSDGVTPGFVIEDRNGGRYMLKLDPPQYPELCSASDAIGSKFFYALGYNTPENYVVFFRRENLSIEAGVQYRDPNGRKHPLTERRLSELLRWPAKNGRRRVSRPGQPLDRRRSGRTVHLPRRPHRRSKRHRSARRPPHAARPRRVQRMAEPPRYALDQHDGHARARRRAAIY